MVDYKRKVAIVGAGLFGLSIAEKLAKLNVDIDIYEKNRKILLGASGNNLNRIKAFNNVALWVIDEAIFITKDQLNIMLRTARENYNALKTRYGL